MKSSEPKAPFKPWPTGLFLSLALFVLAQSSVVYMAVSSFEGLDDVEYYRNGVEYGKEISRQTSQRDLGWHLAPRWQGQSLWLAVTDSDDKPVMKARVLATIGRPATRRQDHEVKLEEVGPGIYRAPADLTNGLWRVRFELVKGDNVVKAEFRKKGGPA